MMNNILKWFSYYHLCSSSLIWFRMFDCLKDKTFYSIIKCVYLSLIFKISIWFFELQTVSSTYTTYYMDNNEQVDKKY